MSDLRPLVIGEKIAELPIIQGGMGVGVSLGRLAGAVAKEGGVGIISTAQIGFYRDDFLGDVKGSNLRAIKEQIELAKNISGGKGLVGVNVMVALDDYKDHVRTAAESGADVVICGAGLPLDLPGLVAGTDAKIAPIVSSVRAARIIFKKWKTGYDRLPDFVVIEGPKAGGHLGFKLEELEEYCCMTGTCSTAEEAEIRNYDDEIKAIIEFVNESAAETGTNIPVVVAGGIFDHEDICHAMELGASGVQIASRFVATHECDASEAYKQAYLSAKEEDLRIIKSPVGMPGRAINNAFLEGLAEGSYKVTRCLKCLAKCNPAQIPYCITERLIMAVKGDVDNGLVFSGANSGRIEKIVSVHELMAELAGR